MALELNGTTGVSLVQDGVVTAADLASGAITSGALPAGSVLQVQKLVDTNAYSISAVGQTLSWVIPITPISSSSLFLLQWVIEWGSTNPNGAMFVDRNQANLNPNISVANVFSGTGHFKDLDESPINQYNTFPECQIAYDSPNTTSEIEYRFGVKIVGAGPQPVTTGRSAASSNYRAPSFRGWVMEIAQ